MRFNAAIFLALNALAVNIAWAHGDSEAQRQWLALLNTEGGHSTTVELLNSGSGPVDVEVRAHDRDGFPLGLLAGSGQPSSRLDLTIAAGGVAHVGTVASGRIRRLGGFRVGGPAWLAIDGPVSVVARLHFLARSESERMLWSASATRVSGAVVLSGTTLRDELVVLINPESHLDAAEVSIDAIGADGQSVQQATASILPGTMHTLVLKDAFGAVRSDVARVDIASSHDLAITAYRITAFGARERPVVPRPPAGAVSNSCGTFPEWSSSEFVLPFPEGTSYELNQANCSGFGHSGFWRYGYDFTMPIGTSVTAARAGVVIFTNRSAADGNPNATNLVTVRHDDGTVALYSHLTRSGVLVEPGERVRAGDPIGLSGNTGNTGGLPHLHFSLHGCASLPGLPGTDSCPSIPVTFRNTDPNPDGLIARRRYRAEDF